MSNHIRKSIQFGAHTLTLETGEIARQAGGAVMASLGDSVVLVTCVAAKSAKPGQDFFPMTVDYQEKTYAAGKIPGGFFRREGRPSEKEILTCRLIDRPLRPLFPDGFYNEVQIVATVMSVDPEIDPDIPAMIGASAAVALSGIPLATPIAAARVGYVNGQYVLNPTKTELATSQLDLVVAGTEAAVLMVESEAHELPEEVMLGAVVFGHQQQQAVIELIHALVEEGGKPLWDWQPPAKDEALIAKVAAAAEADLRAAYQMRQKQARQQRLKEIYKSATAACVPADASPDVARAVGNMVFDLEAKIVRQQILGGEPRIDGRDTRTVRPITIRTGVLPRTHGSALFTRGETQALVVGTLGTARDEQIIDALMGEYRDRFMFHYNFPPYATGETGRVGSPKRREIGHGRLAKRALIAVLPTGEEFAYSMRVVSEITESNGSSSMATVCGGTMAMLHAGVPLRRMVAGIAMGLISDGTRHAVLSDILGDEDHLGDMDFKVVGTEVGITAIQLDNKLGGLPDEVLAQAFAQARTGRLHILAEMKKTIAAPAEPSRFVPRAMRLSIMPDAVGALIGARGANIKAITESTGAKVTVGDDGEVLVYATDQVSAQRARVLVQRSAGVLKVGRCYRGTVTGVKDFGAFVKINAVNEGLVPIEELDRVPVRAASDIAREGEEMIVAVLGADDRGRLRLSRRQALGVDEAQIEF